MQKMDAFALFRLTLNIVPSGLSLSATDKKCFEMSSYKY